MEERVKSNGDVMVNIERIKKNEERLDRIMESIKNLEEALEEFKVVQKDIKLLNKYYGSKAWFEDKEAYETNQIPKVKAGVLSEDTVWDMNDKICDITCDLTFFYNELNNRKK